MRVPRAVFFVGLLLAPAVAHAGKADGMERLLAEGKCADVVAKVDEWEGRGTLGDEAASLAGLRIEGALCVARATDTLAAWSTFLHRFPTSTPAAAARVRVGELAFAAAQAEGTSAAMRRFVEEYPAAPQVAEALKQAEAWDFDDASRAGTPEAIRAFVARYPRSSLREAAWESMVQKNTGIYLVTEGGEPRLLQALSVDGDRITMPVGLPGAG